MGRLYNISLWVFLISIVLFRLPNFYFFPIQNTLFTTQVAARILIGLLFVERILEAFSEKEIILKDKNSKRISLLILSLFAIQSLSILAAQNYSAFLFRYAKDVVPSVAIFFVAYTFRKEYKQIAVAMLLPLFFNLAYQALMLFAQNLYLNLGNIFVYNRHLSFILYNLQRGRIFIDTYDEAAIPLLFLISVTKSTFLNYVLFIILGFFSFISTWRTRILMLFFAFTTSFFTLGRVKLKQFLLFLLVLFMTGYAIDIIAQTTLTKSFLERFTLENKSESVVTALSRINQVKQALELGLAHPLGVGLGNFYDNTQNKSLSFTFGLYNKDVTEGTLGYVHNIFGSYIAESGYLSFFILLMLLAFFAKSDLKTLKAGNRYHKAFVLCFWTIFVESLFNPNVGGAYQVFFWATRGLLLE